jgi:FMN-dependent NADH-azoreductase
MTKVLIINSSALGEASVSNRLTRELADKIQATDPSVEVNIRDIGSDPVPHLTAETVGAIRGMADSDAARATLELSDRLIAELEEADLLVIGSPMYNFGISSTLKTWFDHVLRAGRTFRYTDEGVSVGLLAGKTAVVIETRAGFYSQGPASGLDSQEPHLRTMLGFMGIEDVTYVRAEKLAFGPEAASAAIAEAVEQIGGLAENELALAA